MKSCLVCLSLQICVTLLSAQSSTGFTTGLFGVASSEDLVMYIFEDQNVSQVISTDQATLVIGNLGLFLSSQVSTSVHHPDGFVRSFSMSPNPAAEILEVSIAVDDAIKSTFLIYGIDGRHYGSVGPVVLYGSQHVQVPVGYLTPGMYVLQLADKEGASLVSRLFVKK